MALTKFEVKTNAEMYFNAISSCSSRPFNYVDSVYLFTNENIPVILENSNLNGKLLTVTASLDQALNAILYGVNDITMFDINKIAKFFAELKISAIKFLSYEDFLKLYNLKPGIRGKFKTTFSQNINSRLVEKVCKEMDYYYALFFEELFNLDFFNKSNRGYYYSFISNPNYNLYLKKDKFYELKNILQDINFNEYIDCNLFDIKKHIKNKHFSTILLSNITSYFDEEEFEKFDNLLKELNKNLTHDGVIQIGYGDVNKSIVRGSNPIDREFVLKYKDNIKEIKTSNEIITYYYKQRRKNGNY